MSSWREWARRTGVSPAKRSSTKLRGQRATRVAPPSGGPRSAAHPNDSVRLGHDVAPRESEPGDIQLKQ